MPQQEELGRKQEERAREVEDFFEEVELDPKAPVPTCPFTMEEVKFPVRPHACSHVCERDELVRWIKTPGKQPKPCPVCRAQITRKGDPSIQTP